MSEGSGKWSISRRHDDAVVVQIFGPNGLLLKANIVFDQTAAVEFTEALTRVVSRVADQ